jgi:hypothetical protein
MELEAWGGRSELVVECAGRSLNRARPAFLMACIMVLFWLVLMRWLHFPELIVDGKVFA